MREQGSGTRMAVERLFNQHNLTLSTRMELSSTEAIKQTVLGGLGISVLSMNTLDQNADMRQLAILDVQHFPIKGKWHVAYLSDKKPSVVTRTFLEFLHGASNQLISSTYIEKDPNVKSV